jgi:hypothetical protein
MFGPQQKLNNEVGEQNQKTRKKEEEERRKINARIKGYYTWSKEHQLRRAQDKRITGSR